MPGTEFRATGPIPGLASPLATDEIWTTVAQVFGWSTGGTMPTAELGSQEPAEAMSGSIFHQELRHLW